MALLGLMLALETARLLLRLSSRSENIERRVAAFVHRHSLDEVRLLSSISLVLSSLVLFATIWSFAPLLDTLSGLFPDISTISAERLRLLSPDFAEMHLAYRKAFSAATIACVLLWYPTVRLALRRRQPITRHVAIGGAIVLAFTVVLLDFPYRLLTQEIEFDEVRWETHNCRVLGQRGEDRLIFCPDFPPPRSRTVRSDSLVPVQSAPISYEDMLSRNGDAKRKRSIFRFLMQPQHAQK